MGQGEPQLFGLYLSCVPGQPVARFGTKILIGASRDPVERRKIHYRPKEVVAIPLAEANKYAREYTRAVADGSLVVRSAADYFAHLAQLEGAGAPRSKLKQAESPPDQPAKDSAHANHESGR